MRGMARASTEKKQGRKKTSPLLGPDEYPNKVPGKKNAQIQQQVNSMTAGRKLLREPLREEQGMKRARALKILKKKTRPGSLVRRTQKTGRRKRRSTGEQSANRVSFSGTIGDGHKCQSIHWKPGRRDTNLSTHAPPPGLANRKGGKKV